MRSLLFVPGDSERKLARAAQSAADALIIDLEDSVAPQRKALARAIVGGFLADPAAGKRMFVRINAIDQPEALIDLAALVRFRPYGIVLPKSGGAADIERLGLYLDALEARDDVPRGTIRILPIVTETASAMFGVGSYAPACHPRLCGLTWGGEDLSADIGAFTNRNPDGSYADPYRLARTLCLLGAAAAGVDAIDAVQVDVRDIDALAEEARLAALAGFVAKMAIHPDQIDPIHRAFTPTAEALNRAERIVRLFDGAKTTGVAILDGRMIDLPHYRAAVRLLARSDGLTKGDAQRTPVS